MHGLYDAHRIHPSPNGVNPRAILALAPGVPVAIMASIVSGLEFLFDGAWFSATAVSFVTWYALMRPATAAHARLTPALSEHG